jgi:AcrR family transcriptional regulator
VAKPKRLRARAPIRKQKRAYLPGSQRRAKLLETGMTLVRERGWNELSIASLAQLAGISRQLVYRHFDDVEALTLALAERFQDEVYGAAVSGLERYHGDFASTMRQTLEVFLVGLREERLAYYELLGGDLLPPGLPRSLGRVRARLHRKLIEFWEDYYQREARLSPRDAKTLSSFQYSGLHGLVVLVDGGQLSAEEAIDFFVGAIEASIRKLGGRIPAVEPTGGK